MIDFYGLSTSIMILKDSLRSTRKCSIKTKKKKKKDMMIYDIKE